MLPSIKITIRVRRATQWLGEIGHHTVPPARVSAMMASAEALTRLRDVQRDEFDNLPVPRRRRATGGSSLDPEPSSTMVRAW